MSFDQETMLRRGFVAAVGLLVAFPMAARAADVDIRPVAASGVEGVDWVAGPGPNEITLFDGGQDVAIEMFILNLGTDDVAAYQFALDCNYDFDISGSIDPNGGCPPGGGGGEGDPIRTGECSGVDGTRPDWIFAAADATIIACATTATCPNGISGKFICGAVVIAGSPGAGPGEFYGATFGFAVSADARGMATVGVDLDPMSTLIRDADGKAVPINNVTNGTITVQTGRCCGVPGAPLQCLDDATAGQCAAAGGFFTGGGACTGQPCPFGGVDVACGPTCLPGEGICNDNNACTFDFCGPPCESCYNEDTTPAGMCCAWTTGALTPLDDGDPCTADVCQDDGTVSHVLTIACGEPMGSRYVRFTPPCGAGPTCDDTTMMALRLGVGPGGSVLLGYVQPDGTIGDQPVFNTPAGWGSVAVSGGLIRPDTFYLVSAELQAGGGLVGASVFSTPVLGEVDGDGVATFADVLAVVQAFQGLPGTEMEPSDLSPCVPDGLVNFGDVQWAVFGFQERTFESLCPKGVCCRCPGGCFDYGGFGQLQASCEAAGSGGQWSGGVSCEGFTCPQSCACDGAPECADPCPAENSCVSDANCGPGSVCTPWSPELPCVSSGCACDVKTGGWICLADCGDQCVPGGG